MHEIITRFEVFPEKPKPLRCPIDVFFKRILDRLWDLDALECVRKKEVKLAKVNQGSVFQRVRFSYVPKDIPGPIRHVKIESRTLMNRAAEAVSFPQWRECRVTIRAFLKGDKSYAFVLTGKTAEGIFERTQAKFDIECRFAKNRAASKLKEFFASPQLLDKLTWMRDTDRRTGAVYYICAYERNNFVSVWKTAKGKLAGRSLIQIGVLSEFKQQIASARGTTSSDLYERVQNAFNRAQPK